MNRRRAIPLLVAGAIAPPLGVPALAQPTPYDWRFAICNETFTGQDLATCCAMAARLGYEGIEIDPSTLDEDPVRLRASQRVALRRAIQESGLRYVGMHNLLKSRSRSLHLTTGEASARSAAWSYFRQIVDLSADFAVEAEVPPVLVLGSGKQRDAIAPVAPAEAKARLVEGLAGLASHAQERGVTILLEPLAPHLSNIFHTLAETTEAVRQIGSPAIQTILDTHNTAAETEPVEALVTAYLPHLRHIHVNEMDGSYPGNGDYPFQRLMRSLREARYAGWISVELFVFEPTGQEVAKRSIANLRRWAEAALRPAGGA
jgi:sugar phosphate isomerase/epimerase